MVIGVCHIDLLLHGNNSLKGKRSVVKGIIEKVRGRFNVALAEVGSNDLWGRAELGLVTVGNDAAFVNSVMDKAINYIEALNLAELSDFKIELINC